MDYETASRVDLLNEGVYNYATDPSTHILCLSWAFDDQKPELWWPGRGYPFPQPIIDQFRLGRPRSIHAHNAAFERLITWYVLCSDGDIPEPPLEAFYCTAAQARSRGYPGDLMGLCKALGLPSDKSKNIRGKQLIKALCIPDPALNGAFNKDPELLEEMGAYCVQDVVSERAAEGRTLPLTDEEFRDYCLNEEINDRGLKIDTELAAGAAQYASEETQDIVEEIIRITDGAVQKKAGTTMRNYVFDRLPEEVLELCTYYDKGEKKTRLDKFTRERIVAMDDDAKLLDPVTREVIELVDEAGRSSVSKYKSALLRADPETERVSGAYMFAGAGTTGRFSSRGLQVHNLRRDCIDKDMMEKVRQAIIHGHQLEDGVMDTLSKMLRPMIIADTGNTFVSGDWSSIEAVMTSWLGQSQERLDLFAETAKDKSLPGIYEHAAAAIYRKAPEEIDKKSDERQMGKNVELSCGFGGGVGAVHSNARKYGMIVPDALAATAVDRWRIANPWAKDLWKGVARAAMRAVLNPETAMPCCHGKVEYISTFDGDDQYLFCILPSKRFLVYPKVTIGMNKFDERQLFALKAAWKPKADAKEWPRYGLWHGVLVENIVQATCLDLLREAIRRADDIGWGSMLVGHTHDELLGEVEKDEEQEALEALRYIMLTPPKWLDNFPLNAGFWSGPRYRK
jgi:DNA polymerase